MWIGAVLALLAIGAIFCVTAWLALKWRGSRLVVKDLVVRMAAADERLELLEARLAKINDGLDPDRRYTLESVAVQE